MNEAPRAPGWDAKAIRDVVAGHYGTLAHLFEMHRWPERGAAMMPAQQGRIAALYGSVEAFVDAHANGIAGNAVLNPLAAINAEEPDVWLTSYYGFTPQNWGYLGFTQESWRTRFLKESKPGALVVIYGTGDASPAERRRVLGVQQQSHLTGTKWDFLSPQRVAQERANPDRADRWLYGVKTIRAWGITPETRPFVEDFFPETYSSGKARAIGALGLKVSVKEARRLLDLDLVEFRTWGGLPVDALIPGPAEAVLSPSRPGPVSQSAYQVREAEGPKHLYILRLAGRADHFLGRQVGNEQIVKVGFSVSPATRRDTLNSAFPEGAFRWEIFHSTAEAGIGTFPSSAHALAGEQTMKDILEADGHSLGGEFFLADQDAIERAWQAGIVAAGNWRK